MSAWREIKNGNNTFVEDKGDVIDDEHCILILSRRFRGLHANEYLETMSSLQLTKDETEGEET